MEEKSKTNPISIKESLMFFGIPGVLIYLGLTFGIPFFMKLGCKEVILFPLFLWLPIIPLLPISIILYKKEKNKNKTIKFTERFRLKKITSKDWLWVLSGVVFVFVFDFIVMEPISKWMASIPLFSPPDHFPILFHPLKEIEFPITTLLGVSLIRNWLFLIVTIILHSLAMTAEAFMWRGYILPRQEAKYGKYAWLINGLLWGYLVHFVMPWNFISFLPSMLITPFIAQKTKNTWTSLLVHGIPNMILWVIILTGVLANV